MMDGSPNSQWYLQLLNGNNMNAGNNVSSGSIQPHLEPDSGCFEFVNFSPATTNDLLSNPLTMTPLSALQLQNPLPGGISGVGVSVGAQTPSLLLANGFFPLNPTPQQGPSPLPLSYPHTSQPQQGFIPFIQNPQPLQPFNYFEDFSMYIISQQQRIFTAPTTAAEPIPSAVAASINPSLTQSGPQNLHSEACVPTDEKEDLHHHSHHHCQKDPEPLQAQHIESLLPKVSESHACKLESTHDATRRYTPSMLMNMKPADSDAACESPKTGPAGGTSQEHKHADERGDDRDTKAKPLYWSFTSPNSILSTGANGIIQPGSTELVFANYVPEPVPEESVCKEGECVGTEKVESVKGKRKLYRQQAEQKRRALLRDSFEEIRSLLPNSDHESVMLLSKERLLERAADYIDSLAEESKTKADLLVSLESEIAVFKAVFSY
ncbi:hypothetical protein BC830DRAFT_1112647 [Chytriomyces sp. MP71]|nr:hypothetical protein BC830DRAFT_1112647 [Chytriomyces sp. MP71]